MSDHRNSGVDEGFDCIGLLCAAFELLIAGDQLYAPREDGVVFVASLANGKFEVLSENNMGESVIGSPVPMSADKIIIRGVKHLFCFATQ